MSRPMPSRPSVQKPAAQQIRCPMKPTRMLIQRLSYVRSPSPFHMRETERGCLLNGARSRAVSIAKYGIYTYKSYACSLSLRANSLLSNEASKLDPTQAIRSSAHLWPALCWRTAAHAIPSGGKKGFTGEEGFSFTTTRGQEGTTEKIQVKSRHDRTHTRQGPC
jgi:hypothetical protein